VESAEFKQLAGKVTDVIFNRFFDFAVAHCKHRRPLLIAGGCGLNCEWNTRWRNSGLFTKVFVPPCPNDAGSAIGTAVDAQLMLTGNAKIRWSVYAGQHFENDVESDDQFVSQDIDYSLLAAGLLAGRVLAFVEGRCEIGPRALGHRSIIASPFDSELRDRLNRIKERESFRPVAPICLEEDVQTHFEWRGESPYMLYFQKVSDSKLRAITHVDGTSRVQTVAGVENLGIRSLLKAFKALTGVGVLCNTSLNFPGTGFINRTSDLIRFCRERDVEDFVVNNKMFLRRTYSKITQN
jgi:predicted NodU family carbamoyl transferase